MTVQDLHKLTDSRQLLEEWSGLAPDVCKKKVPFPEVPDFICFQIRLGSSNYELTEPFNAELANSYPWVPSEYELAMLDRAVVRSAESRGWDGSSHRCNESHYVAQISLDTEIFTCTSAIAEDRAIALLAAYLKALRGKFE
jgi:hypothetical protein